MSSIELVYFHSAPNLANHFSVFSLGFEKAPDFSETDRAPPANSRLRF